MSKIKFKIDEKSLFYGIYNDYERGQTATVATPINQARKKENWRLDIVKFQKCGLELKSVPKVLKDACLRKTTSKANSELQEVFVFDKIRFNGISIATDYSFAIYTKKEVDEYIIKRNGRRTKNTHLGRIKIHYPITLKCRLSKYNIDNKKVLDHILMQNGHFAFVVRGFEVDLDNRELNFIASLVGVEGVPLSSVFKRKKGTGKKLLLENIDPELIEEVTINLSEHGQTTARRSNRRTTSSYEEYLDRINIARRENGKKGEKYVLDNFKEIFNTNNIEDIYHTSLDYPSSPYDIEYIEDGVRKFVEVKATSGSKKTFNMSRSEIKFMREYEDVYSLVLLTEINSPFPSVNVYKKRNIESMKKDYPKVVFSAQ